MSKPDLIVPVARPWPIRPDQSIALEFAVERSSAGLFMTPGFGKTAIGLAWLKACLEYYHAKRALLICPLRPMYQVWPENVQTWSDFNDVPLGIMHGTKKEAVLKHGGPVSLINPEGLAWLWAQPKKFRKFDTILIDESTKFKNSQSARSKEIKREIRPIENRLILSGTPRPRSIENIFAQVRLLDDGQRLGEFVTHFRRRFMYDDAPKGADYQDWVPLPGAEDEIYSLISDVCMTMTDDDYDGSPPFIEDVIKVELPAAAYTEYKRMARKTMAMIEQKVITPKNAGGRNIKLRQITSGFIYDERKVAHDVHDAKIEALLDLVEQLDGRPLLVSVEYQHEYVMIQRALLSEFGIDAPYFGQGGITAAQTAGVIKQWQRLELPVIVAHPASAGHGIDGLQRAGNDICFFTLTYDFELYDQIRRRLKRTGQKKPTVVHFIEARATLDEHVRTEIIAPKEDAQIGMFKALRNHLRKIL